MKTYSQKQEKKKKFFLHSQARAVAFPGTQNAGWELKRIKKKKKGKKLPAGLKLILTMENRMIVDAQGLARKDAQCHCYGSISYCAVNIWGAASGWQEDTLAMVLLVELGYKWGYFCPHGGNSALWHRCRMRLYHFHLPLCGLSIW